MEDKMFYLLLLIILSVVLMGCLVILIRSYYKMAEAHRILKDNIKNLEELNDRLRMDRHDYLNHLQIIYGLMELEEYDEMKSYLKKEYKELLSTGKAIKTAKPAVNALLAAKLSECESKEIEFRIEVKSDLKKLTIEDWELCKVLSNLIDNAIKALEDSDKAEKKIFINITENPTEYVFEVENNGPKIPDDIRDRIFKKGFSTKKSEGHGMGLSIVSKILEESNGSISFDTDDERTVFTAVIKKGE